MSARDALRGTLGNSVCNASLYPKRAQPYLLGGDMSAVLDKTTDNLIVAGYAKPRTITTAEELDMLGANAAILAANGCVWVNDGDDEEPWASLAEDFHGGPIWANAADIALPATVLHEPTP
jgi:hypothetical protein